VIFVYFIRKIPSVVIIASRIFGQGSKSIHVGMGGEKNLKKMSISCLEYG